MKIIKLLLLCVALLSGFATFASPKAPPADSSAFVTIVLVRHAEKASADPDTELSERGLARAKRLATLLKDFHFSEIYSTPFKRTRGTIEAIAQQQKKRDHGLQNQ